MLFRKLFIVPLSVLVIALATYPAMAAQKEAPKEAAVQTPPNNEAMSLLRRSAEFLSRAGQFGVTIRVGYDALQKSGQKVEFGEIRKVTLRRPDRFRADILRSDGEKGLVLYDGQNITVFNEKEMVVAGAARSGGLDDAVMYLVSDLGVRLPLAMMFVSTLPAELDRRVVAAEIVEKTTIMDVPCTQVAARTKEVDFQVWIPSEGDPLPRRIVITYKNAEAQPQFRADFSGWDLATNPPDALFSFAPPQGAQRIPFLVEVKTHDIKEKASKKGGRK
ncbi:MAG: DUF2092 domain-containing protein [Acidobacteriota bacterium]